MALTRVFKYLRQENEMWFKFPSQAFWGVGTGPATIPLRIQFGPLVGDLL